MKISVITACFNSAATLSTTLESVLRQEGVAVDYHVIDGGGKDNTVDLLKAWEPKFRERGISFTWTSEPDKGLYDAINKGIARAKGDVVGIVNADDAFNSDDVLAKIARAFEEEKSLQGVFGNIRFVKPGQGATLSLDELRRLRTHRVCFARFWRPWMLQWGYMPPHPSIFVRRECFAQWGAYETDRSKYRIAADYELLIRFFRVNRMRSRYVKVCTTVMRMGGISTKDVEARKKLNEEIILGNRKNGYHCWWPMLLPKYAIKIWEVILPRLGVV